MRFLLDTNVVCEAVRAQPDPRVLSWLTQNHLTCALSALSLGEIWKGIEMMPEGRRRSHYQSWFAEQEADFKDRVLPLDGRVLKTWGTYCAQLKARNIQPGAFDSLIAATALHHQLTLVTRNESDFPDVPLINPWNS